ncbi:MAG: sodium/hydrogen exchanger [candidate division WWE3 bacterium GW2011_GWC1_41_7]|uniref:Sodium/hydrogen exchanger n=3 Tax=Katanobacteria TaxID=422282 RepID=A0A0G0XDH0_UNCKA|nr:MAG: Sodium/hydrogen exchanger [candidate division WWE3 bacterium GW2011_GWB1_41_6]KKS20107.1 MAG: sodium/hydrogen exchanger [candidate division WWE3 bacterium GW2011_GWC1_41_7]KKS22437.1 MAG: Sodium/hydrogen exchanger [candidate division WWE3 bacterium GW2011_GWA1_41_8]
MKHMDNIFYQLALVLVLASGIGLFVLKVKLPLVVAYLITGLVLSVVRLFDLGHSPVFEVLPEIGIAFVLFLIGMELKLNELKVLGKPIFIAAIGQIIISTLLGYAISRLLGFGSSEGLYLGLGLAFSSTVVVIKMLLESRDLSSLFGKLSIGMLLVEDLVAIAVLMMISVSSSAIGTGLPASYPLLMLLLKAAGLFVLTFVLSKYILNKVFEYTAHSKELLYITSITWCFAFTSLAVFAGFSIEIGAFLAGVALASSPYHMQIQAKIKPMRDFFLALFFIYLGSTAEFRDLRASIPIIVIFTLYALIIKPVVYMALLSRFGFRKHTIFQTALNLSQVSEFSLIVLLVGVNAGLIEPITISIMAAVAVLSITVSSILISFSKKVYKPVAPLVGLLETKGKSHYYERKVNDTLVEHIIVIGAHRVGSPIVRYLHDNQIPFIVMDFNPTIVHNLVEKGVNAVYGDIGDPEIIEFLHLEKAKLVICTASDFSDNELLLNLTKEVNKEATVVLRALDSEYARILKTLGADYVLLPEKVSGDYIVHQIKHYWPNVNFKDGITFNNKAISSLV